MGRELKALREATSLRLSASSLRQKRQAVFYYKVVYSLSVFTYFHICVGDGSQGLTVLNLTWDSFFVKCETWLMFSIVSMCTGSYMVM